MGFGGKQGNGNQFISWIHEKDFARAIDFIIEKEITGKVNLVSCFVRVLKKKSKKSREAL
ncbi:epimerase, partial [Flavobacterium covae]